MRKGAKHFFSQVIFIFMALSLCFPSGFILSFPTPAEAAFLTGGNLPNQFANNGTSIYYTSGNLGVGTSNPATLLDLYGSSGSLFRFGDASNFSLWGQDSGGGYTQKTGNAAGTSAFRFQTFLTGGTNYVGFKISESNGFQYYDGVDIDPGTKFVIKKTSGNVGIGTTNPTQKLHLGGSAVNLQIGDSGGAALYFNNTSNSVSFNANQFQFNTTQTLGFTFNGGNVGIGTSAPGAKLDVVGAINAGSTVNGTGLCISGDCKTSWAAVGSASSGWTQNGNEVYKTNTAGNVGIGTTAAAGIGTGIINVDIRGANGGGISFGTTSAAGGYVYGGSNSFYIQSAASTPIIFLPAGTERLRIDAAGNLGIGTTAPSNKLDVSGGVGTTDLRFPQTGYITYNVLNSGSQSLIFRNYGTETMRITPGGAVGIGYSGTFPAAAKLVIGNVLSAASSAAVQIDGFIRAESNLLLHDSTDNTKAINLAYTTANGFSVTTEGAGGGNVGIGKTNPAAVLDVVGSGTFTSTVNGTGLCIAGDCKTAWSQVGSTNADTVDGLHVHSGTNNEANKIVRTDANGYIQAGYLNSGSGNEGNNSNPARVWGTNGSDSYLRTYLTSALSVNYAASAGSATSATSASSAGSAPLLSALGNYVWSAATLPQGYNSGIQSSFVSSNEGFPNYGSVMTMKTYSGGGGSLQMYVPYGPSHGGLGMQVRFGDYNVSSGNSWTSWKTLLASDNYTSYAPSLTGSGASGTWGINITGVAAKATRSNGDFYLDNDYGNSIIGVYSDVRYQGVYSMGNAYKLAANGTTPGNLYGIAWTHSNIGGQSKAVGHQALFMSNGVTQTAIGTGIWTNGTVTVSGAGITAGGTVNGTGLCINSDCKTAWSQVGASQWTTSGTNIYYNTGNVGVGVTNPGYALQVNSGMNAEPYIQAYFNSTMANGYGGIGVNGIYQSHVRFFLNGGTTPKWQIRAGEGNGTDALSVYSWTKGSDLMYFKNDGNIGINKTAPATTLDVVGSISTTGNITATGHCIGGSCITAWSQAGSSNADTLDGLHDYQLFNNMGQNHSTQTDFNTPTNFGFRFIQGTSNGPGISGATQYYNLGLGLGNDYAYTSYAMQFAIPRTPQGGSPYPAVRFREGGAWGSWSKIYAGYADSSGYASSAGSATNASSATNFNNGTSYSSGGNLYTSEMYASSWFRNSNANTGLYNQALGAHFYASAANVWNMGGGGTYPQLILRDNHASTIRGYVYSDASGFGLLHSAGGWAFRTAPGTNTIYMPGNVGIGTETANDKLTVVGASGVRIQNGSYDANLVFGATDAWKSGIRAYDNGDAEMRIWHANSLGQIVLATGYNGDEATTMPTDGLFIDQNKVGIGYASPASATGKLVVNGNVGIGTTAPVQKLWVQDGSIWMTGNGNKLAFSTDGSNDTTPNASVIATENGISGNSADLIFNTWNGSVDAEIMRLRSNGNVGIGITNPSTKLYVSGDVTASAYYYSSDKTLKTNIKTLDNSLDKILQLRGVSFDWKKDGKPSMGLIAQEVKQVYPELINGEDGSLSIQYGNLVAPLIESIKEQQEKINTLEARIKVLEKKKK